MTITPDFLNCVISGAALILFGMLITLLFGPFGDGLRGELRDWLAPWRKG
jgi:hypothetical protein